MEKQSKQGSSLDGSKNGKVALDRKTGTDKAGGTAANAAERYHEAEKTVVALIEKAETMHDESMFIGTTTLRRMLSAVYDENDPLCKRFFYSECGGRYCDFEDDPSIGGEVVYVYYHREDDVSIMTSIKGDMLGTLGSSAGFNGKLQPSDLTEKPVAE